MTKVKICGLSTPEAVATAVKAGADYIGFVFAKSKRQVSLEQAHELAKGVSLFHQALRNWKKLLVRFP